jgi:hypothetical protein
MALAIPMLFALLAQAEPAPPEPVSLPREAPPTPAAAPTPVPEAEPTLYRVGLTGGLAYQLTGDVGPQFGYDVGVFLARRLVPIGSYAQLDVRGQFDYQRFSTMDRFFSGNGVTTYQSGHTLSFFQFSAMPTVTLNARRARPWAGVGGGFVMGHLVTAEEADLPDESKTTRAVVTGAVGLDVDLRQGAYLGFQLAYERLVGTPEFTLQNGGHVQPFGSRLSARLALSYEF